MKGVISWKGSPMAKLMLGIGVLFSPWSQALAGDEINCAYPYWFGLPLPMLLKTWATSKRKDSRSRGYSKTTALMCIPGCMRGILTAR